MLPEWIVFLIMVGLFAGAAFGLKWPVSVSMLLASVGGILAGGLDLAGGLAGMVRHLVEGTFGYVDTILTISTAMIFMEGIRSSGALEAVTTVVVRRFHRRRALLLVLLMLVAMFPGMITGSSSAAVLTAGAVIAPTLLSLGLPSEPAAAFIALAGILGMIAPPVNIPAMIIGGGIDMPYVGFEIPLLLLTFPLAVLFALWFGLPYARKAEPDKVLALLDQEPLKRYGFRLFLPILLVLALMVADKAFPRYVNLGMPLIFLVGYAATAVSGKPYSVPQTAKRAMENALPVLGILAGVGMFIQVMTLTGVRGFIVGTALSVPQPFLFLTIAVSMPLFGAVSAFGSASVLGIPFLLALLGRDTIVTAASLSLIASLGDFMPPTALSAIFAAQVVGVPGYGSTLRKLVVPALIIAAWALVLIAFSKQVRALY